MSAFIVDREDIDVLVTALVAAGVVADGLAADGAGRMLWAENLSSVAYRYPDDGDGDRPGPCDFRDSDVDTYAWEPNASGLDPAQIREVARSYRYQSCEHDGWDASVANKVTAPLESMVQS